jgi:hypothetical protein
VLLLFEREIKLGQRALKVSQRSGRISAEAELVKLFSFGDDLIAFRGEIDRNRTVNPESAVSQRPEQDTLGQPSHP